MAGEKPKKAFTVASFFNKEHFIGWSDSELLNVLKPIAQNNDPVPLGEALSKRIENAGGKILSAYIILHDKDYRRVWNSQRCGYDEVLKAIHFHYYCIFKSNNVGEGLTKSQIAKAIGFAKHMIELPKRGRYAIDNMISYPTHIKYRDKTFYEPSLVKTLRGRDYVVLYSERYEDWKKGAAKVAQKTAAENFEELLDEVRHGRVGKAQLLLDDDMYEVYSIPKFKRQLDEALKVFGQRRSAILARELREEAFSTLTVFIYGTSGSGKSAIAKALVEFCSSMFGWVYTRFAARNAMDEYEGQDVIFLDDVRGGAMEAETWLGLLDPYNESTAAARFYNKGEVAPRLIIISANKDPIEFFQNAKGAGGEDFQESVDTFIRRIGMFLTVRYDYGSPYNVELRTPVHVDGGYEFVLLGKYAAHTGSSKVNVMNLEWRFASAYEGRLLTPYGAAACMLDALNQSNHGDLYSSNDKSAVISELLNFVDAKRLSAVNDGKLAALPDSNDIDAFIDPTPSGGTIVLPESSWRDEAVPLLPACEVDDESNETIIVNDASVSNFDSAGFDKAIDDKRTAMEKWQEIVENHSEYQEALSDYKRLKSEWDIAQQKIKMSERCAHSGLLLSSATEHEVSRLRSLAEPKKPVWKDFIRVDERDMFERETRPITIDDFLD